MKKKKIATAFRMLGVFMSVMLVCTMVPAIALASSEEDQRIEDTTPGISEDVGQEEPGEDSGILEDSIVEPIDSTLAASPEGEGTGEEGPDADEDLMLAMSIVPLEQEVNYHTLKVNVADDGGVWRDVDTIGNAISWNFNTTSTKQIQVIVGFPTGVPLAQRTVEIDIPAGYRILEMTGNSAWAPPAGITKLGLSLTEDDPKVSSVALTALDGSPWPAQLPMGPIPPSGNYFSPYEALKTLTNGRAVYTFNPNCDFVVLTFTLAIDQSILPHTDGTALLRPITVKLTGSEVLTEHLTTTVTNLAVTLDPGGTLPNNAAGGSREVAGTPDSTNELDPGYNTGTVPEFVTGFRNYVTGNTAQSHWVESATLTVGPYPVGVTFTGFTDIVVRGSNATSSANRVNASQFTTVGALEVYTVPTGNGVGHLTATHDPIARTVTLEYTNSYLMHDSSNGTFWLFWEAEIDGSNTIWNSPMAFPATFTETGGALVGNQKTMPAKSGTVNITPVRSKGFSIVAEPLNRIMRDLNAYADQA